MEFLRKLIPLPLQYMPKTYRLSKKGGVNFRLDLHQSVDHFIYRMYPETSADRLLELAAKSKVILDVGANIGSTALLMASVNPQAVIHAFEPHKGNFAKARENLRSIISDRLHFISSAWEIKLKLKDFMKLPVIIQE